METIYSVEAWKLDHVPLDRKCVVWDDKLYKLQKQPRNLNVPWYNNLTEAEPSRALIHGAIPIQFPSINN